MVLAAGRVSHSLIAPQWPSPDLGLSTAYEVSPSLMRYARSQQASTTHVERMVKGGDLSSKKLAQMLLKLYGN